MDVAFYLVVEIEGHDGFGFGLEKSTNLWKFGHDIPRDILRHNSLHEVLTSACHPSCIFVKCGCLFDRPASLSALSLFQEFGIDFCSESFEIFHQNGVIGIDVASTGRNIGFWFGVFWESSEKSSFKRTLSSRILKASLGVLYRKIPTASRIPYVGSSKP
ncbi:hypothetical protein Tco_1113710 [Tanacetum coccineum]|uniref:Uncharacterized protein n=1 Tax=Tanacetum coccineum TaxID=301880 RepID=A0ABQ5ISY2_9ASTR